MNADRVSELLDEIRDIVMTIVLVFKSLTPAQKLEAKAVVREKVMVLKDIRPFLESGHERCPEFGAKIIILCAAASNILRAPVSDPSMN